MRFLKRFNRNTDPYAGSASGTFGNDTNERQMLAGVTYTRLFSATLINEARAGLTRTAHREYGFDAGHDYAAEWGLTGGTREPSLTGFPRFTVDRPHGTRHWPPMCPSFSPLTTISGRIRSPG